MAAYLHEIEALRHHQNRNHKNILKLSKRGRKLQISYVNSLLQILSSSLNTDEKFIIDVRDDGLFHDMLENSSESSSISDNEPKDTVEKDVFIVRCLMDDEKKTLEHDCNCICKDWSRVKLMYKFPLHNSAQTVNLSSYIRCQIQDNIFAENIILGIDIHELNDKIPSCVTGNDLIKNCILEPGCMVMNNVILSDSYIGSHAVLCNCKSTLIQSTFQDNMKLTLGPEAGGGREANVNPEDTLEDVCRALFISSKISDNHIKDSTKDLIISCNIILGDIQNVDSMVNIYSSPRSTIKSCNNLQNIILLPYSCLKNCSSTISNIFMQWNASIESSAVSHTLCMEYSSIGPSSSLVHSTILGPDSHISCGEVHNSLLGPNMNAHHQSLLISTLWPLGRGNVAYGANVGSNHTCRLPDQECTVGEGIFWGLGCVIQFPIDLTFSPYSVIASGVKLPPQRISMPFSLIMESSEGGNEIVPGWVYWSSAYTIYRSEEKFRKRRKAWRHGHYTGWDIISPYIVKTCIECRNDLIHIDPNVDTDINNLKDSQKFLASQMNTFYNAKDMKALGRNKLTERGRKVGILAYTDLIQRYVLNKLFQKVKDILSGETNIDIIKRLQLDGLNIRVIPVQKPELNSSRETHWPRFPWEESDDWEFILSVLQSELPLLFASKLINKQAVKYHQLSVSDLIFLFDRLIQLEKGYSDRIYKSKARDDERGKDIIPGYKEAHNSAESDSVVKSSHLNVSRLKESVYQVTKSLEGTLRSREVAPNSNL